MSHEPSHYLLKLTFDMTALDPTTQTAALGNQLYQIVDGEEIPVNTQGSAKEPGKGTHTFHPEDEAAVLVINKSGEVLDDQLYLIFDFTKTSRGKTVDYGSSPLRGQANNDTCIFELKPAKEPGRWRPKNVVGKAEEAGALLTRNLASPGKDPGSVAWEFDIRLELFTKENLRATFTVDPEMIVDPWG